MPSTSSRSATFYLEAARKKALLRAKKKVQQQLEKNLVALNTRML